MNEWINKNNNKIKTKTNKQTKQPKTNQPKQTKQTNKLVN